MQQSNNDNSSSSSSSSSSSKFLFIIIVILAIITFINAIISGYEINLIKKMNDDERPIDEHMKRVNYALFAMSMIIFILSGTMAYCMKPLNFSAAATTTATVNTGVENYPTSSVEPSYNNFPKVDDDIPYSNVTLRNRNSSAFTTMVGNEDSARLYQ